MDPEDEVTFELAGGERLTLSRRGIQEATRELPELVAVLRRE